MKYFYDFRAGALIAFDEQANEIYQLQGVTLSSPVVTSSRQQDRIEASPRPARKTKKVKKTKTVREFQDKNLFPTRKSKRAGGCDECGSPSKHKKTCSRSSAAKNPPQPKGLDHETTAAIVAKRMDGYSASMITVDLGLSRPLVTRTIKEAGIIDTSGRPDDRYPLRCAKCKEFGHTPSECKVGDALDQLDQTEGWTEPKPGRFTREEFGKVKQAHFQHGIEARLLRMSWPKQGLHEIKKVIAAQNFEEYLADTSSDLLTEAA